MLKNIINIAAILSVLVFSTFAKAADPIRIPVLNWSSQIVMAHIQKQVYEEHGTHS